MLHSGLPRAYLASPAGVGYHHLAGYFAAAEERAFAAAYAPGPLEPYAPWEALAAPPRRPLTPCPLDLSLKPTQAGLPDDSDPIEVDDEEDRRSREEARSQHSSSYGPPRDPDEDIVVDDTDSLRSCSSGHSYHHLHQPQPPALLAYEHQLHQQKLLYPPARLLLTPTHQPPAPLPPSSLAAAPMTPPSTPSPPQCPQRRRHQPRDDEATPEQQQPPPAAGKPRAKKKHARKLKFDEDTSSPVSGTVILGPDEAVVTGDIDPAFNIVEVTEEARAELAKIENRLGPYQCKLCRQLHEDAFQLAQHRCSRIAHVEYRCPECDKRFSCPANLASHRRWHKPRPLAAPAVVAAAAGEAEQQLACGRCDAKFARQAALRKHVASQHPAEPNNNQQQQQQQQIVGEGGEERQREACKQQQQRQMGAAAAAAMEIA